MTDPSTTARKLALAVSTRLADEVPAMHESEHIDGVRTDICEAVILEAMRAAYRDAAKAMCDCCRIDGDPSDLIDQPGESERFVHEYQDGTEIVCGAGPIWASMKSELGVTNV